MDTKSQWLDVRVKKTKNKDLLSESIVYSQPFKYKNFMNATIGMTSVSLLVEFNIFLHVRKCGCKRDSLVDKVLAEQPCSHEF